MVRNAFALLFAIALTLPAAADILITDYGANCNDALNDATAIDNAVAAALAAGGGKVKFPKGRCIYSGNGIFHNPGAMTRAPLYLEGEGNFATELAFTSCSNSYCIELNSQSAIGSGYSSGGGIANMAVSFPSAKNGIKVDGLEYWEIRNVYSYSGVDALTVSESRSFIVEHFTAFAFTGSGVRVIGENFTSGTYKDIYLQGTSTSGYQFKYTKTGTTDTGGLTLINVGTNSGGNSSSGGFLFSGSVVTPFFLTAVNCTADGAWGDSAWKFVNANNVRLVNPWGLSNTADTSGFEFDNSEYIQITGGVAYASGNNGADLEFRNSCDAMSIRGMELTGNRTAYLTDETTHTRITLDNQPALAPVISNDISRFQSHTQARSSAYRIYGQSIPNGTWTPIGFEVNDYDFGPIHSTTTNPSRFTAPAYGQYRASAFVVFGSNPTGLRYLRVTKNGVQVSPAVNAAAINGDATVLHLTFELTMNAGDYVEFEVYQSSGATLGISSTSTATRGSLEVIKNY